MSEVRVGGSLFAGDGEALCAAAVASLGPILLPHRLIGADLAQDRLRAVLTAHRSVPDAGPLYALYAHQRHLPPKVRAFVDVPVRRLACAGVPHSPCCKRAPRRRASRKANRKMPQAAAM